MNSLFCHNYNRDDYLEYLKTYLLPNDFEIDTENVTNELAFTPNKINDITFLGESSDLDLVVYEMKHDSEYDPRVTISRDAFKILASFSKRRALVFFVSDNSPNYRMSLVTIDLKLEGSKIKREYSNPRRFSFLLGEDAKVGTLFDKLIQEKDISKTKKIIDFEDLSARFSVESVSKKFFEEYKRLFNEICTTFSKIGTFKILVDRNENLSTEIFSRKLLGQIVFIYFMQKKEMVRWKPE